MNSTSYLLVSKTASRMACEINERIEEEWHTGDEHQQLVAKADRLERFIEYLQLKRQFEPPSDNSNASEGNAN